MKDIMEIDERASDLAYNEEDGSNEHHVPVTVSSTNFRMGELTDSNAIQHTTSEGAADVAKEYKRRAKMSDLLGVGKYYCGRHGAKTSKKYE